jgi:hypothetical protein
MAISAPLAMLIIFFLMLFFFRKIVLILSPMVVALLSVLFTMGLLVGLGYTVHIMGSMIPIFLMPIAVVDSVHILSEFYDRYRKFGNTRETTLAVMDELFVPMLYTSLTSAAGFASLALTPIPPVQVFGIFVACGIMFAWILTVTFIPAYTMFIPKSYLRTFGAEHRESAGGHPTLMGRMLLRLGRVAVGRAKIVLVVTVLVMACSVAGIARIRVNDNPTKWFVATHPLRIADRVLNRHFGGTYMAYLVIEPAAGAGGLDYAFPGRVDDFFAAYKGIGEDKRRETLKAVHREVERLTAGHRNAPDTLEKLMDWTVEQSSQADDEETTALWRAFEDFVSEERARADLFKRPDMLRYLQSLEGALNDTGVVGKTSSPVTIVKHMHRELLSGKPKDYVIPERARVVAGCYIQTQNGHDPDDLWHVVTPDYRRANVWVQLKSGDNRDMERVTKTAASFFSGHKPPVPLKYRWAGLTYVNVVWQDKMVTGMLYSLLGSFVVVSVMMVFLFRSLLWGALCMVPLSVTIAFIYGLIGFWGKDYDMPVAVLSSLTLGLSVDFAIHYLQRARELFQRSGSWEETAMQMAGEPARAISRNVIVIALGFAPLLPYKPVGFFLVAIMAVSGAGTILILPSLVTVLQKRLFVRQGAKSVCNCGVCAVVGIITVSAVAYVLHHYRFAGWTFITVCAALVVVAAMLLCNRIARINRLKTDELSREK